MDATRKTLRIYIIFLFAGLFLQLSLKGQTVAYLSGDRVYPSDLGNFQLFSYDSSRVFAFRQKDDGYKNAYHLQTYSRESLKLINSIKIPFPDKDSVLFHIENLFLHDDHYQIFYSWFDRKARRQKLDMISFNDSGEKIGETKTIDFSEGKNERKAGGFQVFDRRKSKEFISFGVRDDDLKINHFDYSGNKINEVHFDNVTVRKVILLRIYDGKSVFFITRDNDSYHPDWRVKIYTAESDTPFKMILKKPAENKFYLSDHFYSYSDTSKYFTFITSYSTDQAGKYAKGLYLFQMDMEEHLILREEFIPFASNALPGNGDSEDFSMSACIITDVRPMSERRINILFESRTRITEQMYGTPVGEIYKIGNILSVEMDSNYRINSICRIEKQQKVTNDNSKFTSFNLLNKDGKCFFIYNELPENLQIPQGGNLKKIRNAKLDETSIVLVTTSDGLLMEKKVLVEKSKPDEVDALLIYKVMYTDRNEMYTLRKIRDENFLTKFYLKN